MPAAPPPTPVSHGLKSPRYHGALEGMASPSQRFTGAHMPTNFPAQHYGTSPPMKRSCCADLVTPAMEKRFTWTCMGLNAI